MPVVRGPVSESYSSRRRTMWHFGPLWHNYALFTLQSPTSRGTMNSLTHVRQNVFIEVSSACTFIYSEGSSLTCWAILPSVVCTVKSVRLVGWGGEDLVFKRRCSSPFINFLSRVSKFSSSSFYTFSNNQNRIIPDLVPFWPALQFL